MMLGSVSRAQDIHFSQTNLTPIAVNPGQTGAYKAIQAILNYKTQWTSISPQGYKTMMMSYDQRLNHKKWKTRWLAWGLTLFSDKAGNGNLKTNQANLTFGYHVQLNDKSVLGGCLLGGFAQRSIDYTKLTWDEQYINGSFDPNASSNEPVGKNSFGYPDVGMGILYQFNKGQLYSSANDMVVVRVGYAVTHLNMPAYNFYDENDRLFVKHTAHSDAIIGIKNTHLALVPGMLFMQQGPSNEFLPSWYFRYMLKEESRFTGFVKGASIKMGGLFRVRDAFIPAVQFEFGEYMIGVSYDMNISKLNQATSGKGGFEISLRYGNPNPFTYKTAASFQ